MDMTNDRSKYIKYQNTLFVAGQSIILLCIWSLVKLFMYLTVDNSYFDDVFGDLINTSEYSRQIYVIIFVVVSCIDIMFHITIGRRALANARGYRVSRAYLFMAAISVIVFFVSLLSTQNYFIENRISEDIVCLILDIVSIGIYIALIVSGIYVRRYQGKISKERG